MGIHRIETPEEFHRRMIERCEIVAARHERDAQRAVSEAPRANCIAKMEKELRNAELHRNRLADLMQ